MVELLTITVEGEAPGVPELITFGDGKRETGVPFQRGCRQVRFCLQVAREPMQQYRAIGRAESKPVAVAVSSEHKMVPIPAVPVLHCSL